MNDSPVMGWLVPYEDQEPGSDDYEQLEDSEDLEDE